MSEATTRGIRIRVQSQYVASQSSPEQGYWFFAYHVHIENVGEETAQLISRHWIITDGDGNVDHVRGPGVVGAQPHLGPGESFDYQSACPLPTPVGAMNGTFQMVTDAGESFDAEVAPFTLAAPNALN